MIGYGFLNSEIQNFALRGIISSFLERSLIFLYPAFLYKKDNILTEQVVDRIFNLFIQEEIFLSSPEEAPQKNIVKYVLSSNVIKNKDYDFINNGNEKAIEDGKINLKDIFKETLNSFYKSEIVAKTKQNYSDFYKKQVQPQIVKSSNNAAEVFALQKTDIGSESNLATALENEILGFKDNSQSSDPIENSTYLKKIIDITDFYKKNKFLEKRNIYLNILNQQINSLNQGDKI